jgi:hypothetical protein
LNAAGTTALGNRSSWDLRHRGRGRHVDRWFTTSARNVISGNVNDGIVIDGGTSQTQLSVRIQGNYIGTDITGEIDLGNTRHGIYLWQSASGVDVIGNVISGNNSNGILLENGIYNDITGNIIGLDKDGTTAIGNSSNGIRIAGATFTTIGGLTGTQRNIISANTSDGINLSGASLSNVILGNYIGTDRTGSAATGLGNTGRGIYILSGANGNTIGGTTVGAGNVISGQSSHSGVFIEGNNNVVQGNIIGPRCFKYGESRE